jgi:hypothetical protein
MTLQADVQMWWAEAGLSQGVRMVDKMPVYPCYNTASEVEDSWVGMSSWEGTEGAPGGHFHLVSSREH